MERSYSGSVTFEVDRIKNNISGEYFFEEEIPDDEFDSKFEWDRVELEVIGTSWFYDGVYHLQPEDCYPDEGSTEVQSIIGPDNKDWLSRLTASELEEAYLALERRRDE